MQSLPAPDEPYRIVRSAEFQAEWDAGVASGWLNPMVHPAQLEFFIQTVLPTTPFLGRPIHGAAVNIREIRFPRGPRSRESIGIIYTVIEDDRTVELAGIYLIS
jgi:hypothetical protein